MSMFDLVLDRNIVVGLSEDLLGLACKMLLLSKATRLGLIAEHAVLGRI